MDKSQNMCFCTYHEALASVDAYDNIMYYINYII